MGFLNFPTEENAKAFSGSRALQGGSVFRCHIVMARFSCVDGGWVVAEDNEGGASRLVQSEIPMWSLGKTGRLSGSKTFMSSNGPGGVDGGRPPICTPGRLDFRVKLSLGVVQEMSDLAQETKNRLEEWKRWKNLETREGPKCWRTLRWQGLLTWSGGMRSDGLRMGRRHRRGRRRKGLCCTNHTFKMEEVDPLRLLTSRKTSENWITIADQW